MKKNIQKIHSYTFDNDRNGHADTNKIYTEKSSFLTLEKAIENSMMWINKTESWIDTTVTEITIINKETKEVLWTYKAEDNASKLGKMIGKTMNIRRQ